LSPPAQRALAIASAAKRTERGGRGRALVITKEGSAQAQRSEAEAMETEEQILEQ
jgi:O-acetyl-ADP-ribose deacetylase (regulator of RNase III)